MFIKTDIKKKSPTILPEFTKEDYKVLEHTIKNNIIDFISQKS